MPAVAAVFLGVSGEHLGAQYLDAVLFEDLHEVLTLLFPLRLRFGEDLAETLARAGRGGRFQHGLVVSGEGPAAVRLLRENEFPLRDDHALERREPADDIDVSNRKLLLFPRETGLVLL